MCIVVIIIILVLVVLARFLVIFRLKSLGHSIDTPEPHLFGHRHIFVTGTHLICDIRQQFFAYMIQYAAIHAVSARILELVWTWHQ